MKNVTNLRFKDKDGDDGEEVEIDNISIRQVSNGFIVTMTDSEGDESIEVFSHSNYKELLNTIEAALSN